METKRLKMRKFTPADFESLIEIRCTDADVAKYIGGKRMQNPETLKKRLEFYISCYARGIGVHAMIWKETGDLIGWSGLQPLEDSNEIEVSYGMIKKFWGRGIGSEAAAFWLEYGFENLGLERIVAALENTNSRRIMEKLGMKYEKKTELHGMDCAFYAVLKREFFRQE